MTTITAEMLYAEAEELKKRVDAMEEEMEEKKKENGGSDKDKDKDGQRNGKARNANEDDPEKDKEMNANESEDMKKIKQENAMLSASLKKPIIEKVLNASKLSGADEKQLKFQEDFLNAASLKEATEFEANFFPAMSYGTNMQNTPIPDLGKAQIAAGQEEKSGEELLKEAGVY